MSEQENFNLDEVISGEKKIEYVDKLELLREKVNSKSVLSSRSNKKELIESFLKYHLKKNNHANPLQHHLHQQL